MIVDWQTNKSSCLITCWPQIKCNFSFLQLQDNNTARSKAAAATSSIVFWIVGSKLVSVFFGRPCLMLCVCCEPSYDVLDVYGNRFPGNNGLLQATVSLSRCGASWSIAFVVHAHAARARVCVRTAVCAFVCARVRVVARVCALVVARAQAFPRAQRALARNLWFKSACLQECANTFYETSLFV